MVLLLKNGKIFIYMSEILYWIHKEACPFSCSEQTHILNPTSPLSKEKVRRNFPTHTMNFILGILAVSLAIRVKACRVCLPWADPFRDCHPKLSKIKPYTNSLENLYQRGKPKQTQAKKKTLFAILTNNSID